MQGVVHANFSATCRVLKVCQQALLRFVQESFHYFKYKKNENILYEYADDVAPRHLTAALPLDYDTIAGGDKFGNLFLTRLPADISAQVGVFWTICGRALQTMRLDGKWES